MPDLARRRAGDRQAGQALPLMILVLVALIAMSGAVIDGGNLMANQRGTQNGTDAAAEAGAIVLARRMAGSVEPGGGWDAAVQAAITASAAANGITVTGAYYTDICGIPLKADGTASLTFAGTYDFSTAKIVGQGLPTPTSTTPDCPSRTVGPVAGVIVLGHREVTTYFSGIVGIRTLGTDTQTTAAAGFLQETCAASEGEACGMLPIALPVNWSTCGNNNSLQDEGSQWVADGKRVYIVPLCSNGPGNVGYIDWTPPSGGTAELIASVTNPSNPAVSLPSWQYIASTGNVNSSDLETAIRAYDGQVVLVPEFDLTCSPSHGQTPDSTVPVINTAPNYGCPAGDLYGQGATQWYRIPSFTHFRLCSASITRCHSAGYDHGIYLAGSNPICNGAGGNGATACLIGTFESIIRTGTIGAAPQGGWNTSNSKAIGIQIIK